MKLSYSIEYKLKKSEKNIYLLNYLPIVEITDLEVQKKSTYIFGDFYSSNGEFYFVNIDTDNGNFVGVYTFNFSEVKDYYKKSKTIDFLEDKTYIGNWFELDKSMQRVISYKIFNYKGNLITDFNKELNEIIENVLAMNFTLKNEFKTLSIKDLNDSFFKDGYLDIQFLINLDYSCKEKNEKYLVPLESLYKDFQSNFCFYINVNKLGIVQVFLDKTQFTYDKFISNLLMMNNSKSSNIKKNYHENNIYNKYINTLEYIYIHDEIEDLINI